MTTRTIELSEEAARRLDEQAKALQLTPGQLIEQLLAAGSSAGFDPETDSGLDVPEAGSAAALAAVRRLAAVFAGVSIPDLEQTLTDPLLALANADVIELVP